VHPFQIGAFYDNQVRTVCFSCLGTSLPGANGRGVFSAIPRGAGVRFNECNAAGGTCPVFGSHPGGSQGVWKIRRNRSAGARRQIV